MGEWRNLRCGQDRGAPLDLQGHTKGDIRGILSVDREWGHPKEVCDKSHLSFKHHSWPLFPRVG